MSRPVVACALVSALFALPQSALAEEGCDPSDPSFCDDGNTVPGDGCYECMVEPGWHCSVDGCYPWCGDGVVVGDETCDDGNGDAGDGCSDICTVEGPPPCDFGSSFSETRSSCVASCGDGFVAESELCDDGNVADGDGCKANCRVEAGFACTGSAPSVCTHECGDGMRAVPVEDCDDGNATNADGCSDDCHVEAGFVCGAVWPHACTPMCGDGMRMSEEGCDDGNGADGDGCSSACAVEPGFDCSGTPAVCEPEPGPDAGMPRPDVGMPARDGGSPPDDGGMMVGPAPRPTHPTMPEVMEVRLPAPSCAASSGLPSGRPSRWLVLTSLAALALTRRRSKRSGS